MLLLFCFLGLGSAGAQQPERLADKCLPSMHTRAHTHTHTNTHTHTQAHVVSSHTKSHNFSSGMMQMSVMSAEAGRYEVFSI